MAFEVKRIGYILIPWSGDSNFTCYFFCSTFSEFQVSIAEEKVEQHDPVGVFKWTLRTWLVLAQGLPQYLILMWNREIIHWKISVEVLDYQRGIQGVYIYIPSGSLE